MSDDVNHRNSQIRSLIAAKAGGEMHLRQCRRRAFVSASFKTYDLKSSITKKCSKVAGAEPVMVLNLVLPNNLPSPVTEFQKIHSGYGAIKFGEMISQIDLVIQGRAWLENPISFSE